LITDVLVPLFECVFGTIIHLYTIAHLNVGSLSDFLVLIRPKSSTIKGSIYLMNVKAKVWLHHL